MILELTRGSRTKWLLDTWCWLIKLTVADDRLRKVCSVDRVPCPTESNWEKSIGVRLYLKEFNSIKFENNFDMKHF